MKEIELNKRTTTSPSYKKYKMIVDDEDFDFLNQWNWSVKPHGKTFYAVRTDMGGIRQSKIYAHRLLFGLSDKNVEIDHRDNNGLNNQRSNLRTCSHSSNSKNRRLYNKKGSQYKGVKMVSEKSYMARIRVNGELIYLGVFINEKDAALAYNEAAIKHHGDFSNLNIIQC